jgi:hypothetical protein
MPSYRGSGERLPAALRRSLASSRFVTKDVTLDSHAPDANRNTPETTHK